MKILTVFVITCIIFSLCSSVHAVNENMAAVPFLLLEPGAKQAGMGEAHSALADDAYAGYYNPAGLAFQNRELRNLQFMHTRLLPKLASDMYYDYLGYSQNVEGWGSFAFNIIYVNYGKQYRTSEHSEEIIGEFESFDTAISGSYGTNISETLSLGFTLKGIYSKLAEQGSGSEEGKGIGASFAFDIGAMYKPPVKNLQLAAVLHNLGPKISYVDVDQADPLPLNFVVGASYIPIDDEFSKLTFVFDIYKPLVRKTGSAFESLYKAWNDEDDEFKQVDFRFGTEYIYGSFLALRVGYSYDNDGDLKTPTFGLGIMYEQIHFDVAVFGQTDNPNQNGTRFSFSYDF